MIAPTLAPDVRANKLKQNRIGYWFQIVTLSHKLYVSEYRHVVPPLKVLELTNRLRISFNILRTQNKALLLVLTDEDNAANAKKKKKETVGKKKNRLT